MANKLDEVEFSHVNTITKEAGFSGFTDVQTAWPYISWRLSVIINKSRNSSSKDRPIQFYSQCLKKAFLFAETNYFCTIVSEDLVNSDAVIPRLSSARSRTKRFALYTHTT